MTVIGSSPSSLVAPAKPSRRYDGMRLFALSFAALFLELMVIRWVPAVVSFVAYYSNLMLISSFLGLGLGMMMAHRIRSLLAFFPLLLLVYAQSLVFSQFLKGVPFSAGEARFGEGSAPIRAYFGLLGVFAMNAAIFVPLGQEIGRLFLRQAPLRAYAFDLGGSLCGSVVFGLFSFYHFSPALGICIVGLIYLACTTGRRRWLNLPVLAAIALTIPLSTDPNAIWSPYYYVTVHDTADPPDVTTSEAPTDLRAMFNPRMYTVSINTNFYQWDATIDPKRYSADSPLFTDLAGPMYVQYSLPYRLHPQAARVCVIGAGGGLDVEAALLNGAASVDAVEIDPNLVDISRRFNPSGVYDDPRVTVHINDARSYFQNSSGGYDLVVYGLIDSQSLFSYSNNIRLDGYIYTVQSVRRAYSLLKPDGMLAISFMVPRHWLGDKLKAMVREATGQTPVVYRFGAMRMLCVPRTPDSLNAAPPRISIAVRESTPIQSVDLPTDDWPYLYLSHRAVPRDYLLIIGSLLALSAAAVMALRLTDGAKKVFDAADGLFFFMGMGFLLLETKSIGDCSLYFGATWLVTTVVITGVLLMVLAANLLAARMRRGSLWLYLPLLASLIALYFAPREQILALPFAARLAWAVLIVPLPIFFAGLIFSTAFKHGTDPSALLGANLIGATIGGFLEYLSMAVGIRALMLIVMIAYILSWICQHKIPRPIES
jgi:hypothetical protein